MTDSPPLLVDVVDDAILVATLNRPDKLNALNRPTLQLLNEAILRYRDDPALKVMLIRATGRYFSSGADLKEEHPGERPTTGSGLRAMHRLGLNGMHSMYDEMEAIEKPIVAAHQATCVGGGLELSLSCDFRLAARSARYSFPEGLFGVLPASNGVSRLTRIVGPHWARYLVMANLKADAERALVMGLVHEVYPDETFDEDALNFCRHLAKQNLEQMGTAKLAIELAADVGLAQARNVERLANVSLMMNPDYITGYSKYITGIGGKKEG